uniref:Uncharacterized protein n=1 Tax=Manihot esculenta TaxID=3983 RepID=A0A2C9VCX3_MANES
MHSLYFSISLSFMWSKSNGKALHRKEMFENIIPQQRFKWHSIKLQTVKNLVQDIKNLEDTKGIKKIRELHQIHPCIDLPKS